VTDWLLLDYGGVLCTPQPEEDRAALVRAAGAEPAEFWAAYWRDRGPYDRAELDPAAYWAGVLERQLTPAEVAELDRLDVASWSHPQQASLDVVGALKGVELALLSNAPATLADAIEGLDWVRVVPRRFYSCRLGLTKPDPEAYAAVLDALGAKPADVTFVDDKPENVHGAQDAGLRAVLFSDPAALRTELAADLGDL
jgi:putative hydrolase of the HAD superfamily